MSTNANSRESMTDRSFLRARLTSVLGLCAALGAIGWVGNTVYRIATDSFVAPVVLSPDSDLVIQSKLSMGQLRAEQMRITTKRAQIETELRAAELAVERLKELHAETSTALDWTVRLTTVQAAASAGELRTLGEQDAEIRAMIAQQAELVERMKGEYATGLATKAEYAAQVQELAKMRLSALENSRARVVSAGQASQVRLAQEALRATGSKARLSSPETLAQRDHLVRIECDILKLEAEMRAKSDERAQIDIEMAKLDELLAQLNSRPVFRALQASTNVAFVPYSQIDGVESGREVYECVWSVFACKAVGRVSELLPGEVIVPDPWGTPARGQYAILELRDPRAAQSRALRVRPDGGRAPAPVATGLPVAQR